ncbi:MAG TPA: NAD(P)-dependent oxidoreductase [Reyranella sp.]|jgi:3-hydroxyisobutyrate dehydrogenase-like beta-hydroxyacid dehydrogenase|nr:NAD(P)-dependent oxidoreductase [Reyranella sp.]
MADLLGFVGVGRMGGPMANRLLDAGYRLCVYDVSDEATRSLVARGAELAASPAEVASIADTVFMSLPTPDVVREVALGGNGGLINGSRVRTVIDLSTTGPGVATEVAGKLAERKIAWVDSPVSGGVTGAKAGTLAVMVSCPTPAYQQLEPVLKVFGKLFHAGEKPGLAQTAKLANNLLAATAMVATSEVMAMGVKAGLDAKVLIDIINASSGRNSASQDKFPRAILPRTFDFGFATGLSYKDVRLCVEEAEAMGVPMVVGGAVREMLAVTRARFGAGSDFTYIAKVLEEWAGVEIKG